MADTQSHRPNILYVFTDQQRSTAIGCAGVEDVQTPHIDRFAAQGTRFSNAIANTPVCCPSRASLLTGLFPLSHGVVCNDLPLRTDVPHLAQGLTAAGYRCGYIGKWHIDEADRAAFIPPGLRRRGFDDFWAVANCTHDYNDSHSYLNDDPEPYWHAGYDVFSQTDMAIEYLRSRGPGAADRPFCLFLSFGPPHCPYTTAPQEFRALYADKSFRLLPNIPRDIRLDPGVAMVGAHAAVTDPRDLIAGYYAHVSAIDAAFGRLMAEIDSLGLAGDTLVIFTSDHGDMLFSQGRGWKCKPWRESVGIPMVMRWPGRIAAGRVTDGPIGVIDMMPTLLSLAGAPAPAGLHGQDASAFILGDEAAAPPDQPIMMPCMPGHFSLPEWRGVVTRTHTFAATRQGPWLLFDDSTDRFQMTNLAEDAAHRATCDALAARTQAWLARASDGFESSRAIADRYAPGHKDNVAPYFMNETVKSGRRDPSRRRYRRAGQGL